MQVYAESESDPFMKGLDIPVAGDNILVASVPRSVQCTPVFGFDQVLHYLCQIAETHKFVRSIYSPWQHVTYKAGSMPIIDGQYPYA